MGGADDPAGGVVEGWAVFFEKGGRVPDHGEAFLVVCGYDILEFGKGDAEFGEAGPVELGAPDGVSRFPMSGEDGKVEAEAKT